MSDKGNNDIPKDYKNILEGKSPELVDQVQEVIKQLKKANNVSLESALILMCQNILDKYSGKSLGEFDFNSLSEAEKQAIIKEITEILQELELSALIPSATETIELIISILQRAFSKTKKKDKELEFLTERDKKRIEEELKRAAIYELYKITNPHRIAGETERENFFNNAVTRGVAFARKFEGGGDKDLKNYDKSFFRDIEKARHNFLKSGGFTAFVKESNHTGDIRPDHVHHHNPNAKDHGHSK